MMVTIKQWAEALESGEYPQSAGRLRTETGYCCWGVLCELSGEGEWMPYSDSDSNDYAFVFRGEQFSAMPPMDLTPFPAHQSFAREGAIRPLDSWNDKGLSFVEIAKMLRKKFPGEFAK